LVQGILADNSLTAEVKQGVHLRHEFVLKQPIDPEEPVFLYHLEGPAAAARTSTDAVEMLAGLWQEVECISVTDAVDERDKAGWKTLHKVRTSLWEE
jgi:enolase